MDSILHLSPLSIILLSLLFLAIYIPIAIWLLLQKEHREKLNCYLSSKIWHQWIRKKGKITAFVLKINVSTLVIGFVVLHFSIAALFAYLFISFDGVYRNDETNGLLYREKNFLSCLYFSSLNQTTLGGGQLIPKNSSVFILSVQSIGSLLLNSIMFGLIVYRIINRKPNIVFPKKIAFDCKDFQGLTVQVWNKDSDSFYAINISVSVTRRVKTITGDRTNQSYFLLIDHDTPDLFLPGMVVYGWTLRKDHRSFNASYHATYGIRELSRPSVGIYYRHLFDLIDLQKDDKIDVVFNGISVNKGSHIIASKPYTCDEIECGTYENITPFEKGNYAGPKKYKNFWKINKEKKKCKICLRNSRCIIYRRERS